LDSLGSIDHKHLLLIQPELQMAQCLGRGTGSYPAIRFEITPMAGAEEPSILSQIHQATQVWTGGIHGVKTILVSPNISFRRCNVLQPQPIRLGLAQSDDLRLLVWRLKGEKAHHLTDHERACCNERTSTQPEEKPTAVDLPFCCAGDFALLVFQ
jgi:hypothetical protein